MSNTTDTQILANDLREFNNLLRKNSATDWSDKNAKREFTSLVGKLQTIIDKIPDERAEMCERLSHLICDDEDRYNSMEEALQLLEKQEAIDGSVWADDIVLMWCKVEYTFTVDELLSEIGW